MDTPIIDLQRLSKQYGTLKAVNNLQLQIKKGEIFGLLGPNGAGKSTTILMMLGLTEPTSGYAKVCGFDATSNPIEVKKRVGYLPDNVGFYDNRSGLENLVYVARLNQVDNAEIVAEELLYRVGLAHAMHKKVGAYSRGMKQRLGLADVLIKNPEVIVLDEPTLGIDPSGVRDFLKLIHQLSKEQQLTVLLSSHHLHQVQQVCDRVGLFVQGELLAEGDIATLANTLFEGELYVVEAEVAQNLVTHQQQIDLLLGSLPEVSQIEFKKDKMFISCNSDVTSAIAKLLLNEGFDLHFLRKREYGLDDIYQRYFENKPQKEKAYE
ncbi:ABC transporter ATP-binding protein [Zhouia sp. PK063]|uniref:ABC transporter ATP-binding protein n=1 Tax=Zhouia sp. PK063 TaxID=3373602 RepID=UPI0037A25593